MCKSMACLSSLNELQISQIRVYFNDFANVHTKKTATIMNYLLRIYIMKKN